MFTRTKRIKAAASPRATRRLQAEGSFTLIETVIALAIVTFLIVEVAAVQGNSIVFADYGRNITQATWLARRVLSQVEYYWRTTKSFKDLQTNTVDQKFDDSDEYSYSLEIKEWKFPFVQMIEQALGGPGDKEQAAKDGKKPTGADGGTQQMIEGVVKQIFGDEPIFLTAHVEVSWPEGAQRGSTSMTYLLTNQAKLDAAIVTMKPVYERLTKPPPKKPGTPANVPRDANGNPIPPTPVDPNAQPQDQQPPPGTGGADSGDSGGQTP